MSAYTEIPKIIAETGELPPKVLGNLEDRFPGASKTSADYWVAPPPLGNDENDGSEDYPLATIAAAVDRIPDLIRADHTITITLLPGEWDEEILVKHKIIFGHLILQGSSGDRDRHKVLRVATESVIGHATFKWITGTETGRMSGQIFRFRRSAPHMEVIGCKSIGDPETDKGVTAVIGLLADYGSQVHVSDSDFSNRRYGIRSNYLSRVHSHNNTGTNNTFGVGARWGGIVSVYGTHPEGDTNFTTDSGGVISFASGGRVGRPNTEPGFLHDTVAVHDGVAQQKTYWIDANTARHFQDIPSGKIIRARFRRRVNGQLIIRATYGAQLTSTTGQSMEKHFHGFMTNTSLGEMTETIVTSHSMPADRIQVVHAGYDGIFDLLITPQPVNQSWWGAEIKISMMRGVGAPDLLSIDVLDA